MTATLATTRNIQVSTATLRPDFKQQGASPITSPNGWPSGGAAGVPVADSSGESAVTGCVFIRSSPGTTYSVRFWGYYASGALAGEWGTLGFGLQFDGVSAPGSEILPSGPYTRLYCEVLNVSGGGVEPFFGPAGLL